MKQKLLLLLVSMVLVMGCYTATYAIEPGLDNFQKINDYTQGQFTDVSRDSWYAGSVQAGYEYGLIKGNSATTFNPSGNMTLSEAITLAARLHSIYHTGKAEFIQGNPWFQVYVDYALDNGIIQNGEHNDYTAKATRAQFATIFAAAFPENALERINNIEKIPDVPVSEDYSKAVYKLYNAGILTGNDEYGTFSPNSNIKRSEVAAIVTRMADKSLRKKVDLKVKPIDVESIAFESSYYNLKVGEKLTLEPVFYPQNATNKDINWSSSRPDIAAISSSGEVTGLSAGIAVITGTSYNGKKGDVSIVVSEILPTSISLNKKTLNIYTEDTYNLKATISPSNASNKEVIWRSTNEYVAQVSSSGRVLGVGEGSAYIYAESVANRTINASCKVNVTLYDPAAIEIERHEKKIQEINSEYKPIIEAKEETFENLKKKYGVSYLYSSSYYAEKVSSLKEEISTKTRRMLYLQMDTTGGNQLAILRLEKEIAELEDDLTEMMILQSLALQEEEIDGLKKEYNKKIEAENSLHQYNMANLS